MCKACFYFVVFFFFQTTVSINRTVWTVDFSKLCRSLFSITRLEMQIPSNFFVIHLYRFFIVSSSKDVKKIWLAINFDYDSNPSISYIHQISDLFASSQFLIVCIHLAEQETIDDPIFITRWMLRTLQRDLLMLENQLPFVVLRELFKLTSTSSEEPPLTKLVLFFFDPLLPRENIESALNQHQEHNHMLDVFRSTFLSSINNNTTAGEWKQLDANMSLYQERQLIHCVVELKEVGVQFRKGEDSDLLDIKFEGGVLEIPPLIIDDNTVPLLLNFVAYEQCDEDAKPFFTNFFMFFDSLINSHNDVEILHKNGIINHVLGSDKDVANLFNKLCREIVYDLDECYLSKQMKGVNEYCKAYYATRWHVWWTNLIRDYFSSPWTFLSLLAAIVLLFLTAAQTFYTVYAYYRPINNN